MARFIDWIKEHPFSTALMGLGLGWAIKVSLKEYMPEHIEPRGTQAQGLKAKSLKQQVIRRPASRGAAPGELTGEFKELLEEPPAI